MWRDGEGKRCHGRNRRRLRVISSLDAPFGQQKIAAHAWKAAATLHVAIR